MIETRSEPMYCASVLDGKRAGPPEDVGGIPGHGDFVDSITNHRYSEEAEDRLRWAGGEFEAFDRRTVNNTLAQMAWNGWGKK